MEDELEFFITTMPDSRPADYYLGCYNGMVYLDFDNCEKECICLIRISFDGYGCCNLEETIPMNEIDSRIFKELIKAPLSDQRTLISIVKKTILNNRKFIWKDALDRYGL
jgi:hypothetical protein